MWWACQTMWGQWHEKTVCRGRGCCLSCFWVVPVPGCGAVPPVQGSQTLGTVTQRLWRVGVEFRNESCDHVWGLTGLALRQADVLVPVSVARAGKKHQALAQQGSSSCTMSMAKSCGSCFTVLESSLEPSSWATVQKPEWIMLPVLSTESCTYQICQPRNL